MSGCAMFGGDMPIRVAGSVPVSVSPKESDSACRLGLMSSNTGKQLSYRDVSTEFLTSFVIEAKPKSYFFIARCAGGREFQSGEIMAGGRDSFNRLIDLGLLKDRDELQSNR
jgi:hypothetical protein